MNASFNRTFLLIFAFCLLPCRSSTAAPKPLPAKLEGIPIEDLAAPYNLQAKVANKSVGLSWAWDPPAMSPAFLSFGYEVMRDTTVIAVVPKTGFSDFGVPIGSHTYKVRAKGGSKEMKKNYAHVSTWSEPSNIVIQLTCEGPPAIELTVTPNKTVYRGNPALRLRLKGSVSVPPGCQLDKIEYHIDNGIGTPRSAPLTLDAKGHFDTSITTMGPDEEPLSGSATYTITATANDEAGDASSGSYTLDLQQANPFAPHNY